MPNKTVIAIVGILPLSTIATTNIETTLTTSKNSIGTKTPTTEFLHLYITN